MLKKYHDDGNYIIRWDSVLLDENLSYEEEPVAILNREVRKLRSKEIASIKVQWKNRPVEESTWESEADMQERYPHLFVDSVLKRVGEVAYELALPPGLSGVHPVFHVSMLKKYHDDGNYIIRWDSVLLDENLSYEEEPVAILNREVRKLRSKEIASIKVQWKNRPVEESTWESEADMQERYPHLFVDSVLKRVGEVAYELALPPGLSGVHPVFHVSMLKKYHDDGNYIIRWDSVLLDENLSYEEEPVAILNREVRKLRSKEIASIKVQWKNRPVEESTWESEADMQERYPHLFVDSVLKRVGEVAYELALPPGLSGVHPVFHVSMLKKYHDDGNYIIRWDSVLLDENLSYEEEPVAILNREVRKLRSKEIASIKVQWKNRPVEESTWESEADMQERYPHLFVDSVLKRVGEVAYELALPPGLSGVHPVFHVSMLKKYHDDGNYIIRWDSVLLDENLSYEEEPVAILNREVRKLRSKEIASIKVQWKNRPVEESTWESEADMQERYPHLFVDSVLKRVGEVAYELALPPGLSGVHPVFHVSMLKKYHDDGNYIIRWDSVLLDENLSYEEEPVAILNREVRKLRSKEIASIKVQWKNRPVEESTWESEADMQERYPHLFVDSVRVPGTDSYLCFLRFSFVECSKCTIDFDSPSALASLPHIRFQGELFLLARAGFSQLWCDVLDFRTWTNVFTYFGVSNTFRLDMLRTDVLDVMTFRFWG
ncbi:hypothetical protein MTR67_020194 [Solanum verrucosum]|uniref:Chromo domain-containing protein n=1 Tax=Solanum verrucosum TaxID=315347 RepID=A0AAF0QVN7_SOLVR|nr:hypothetical protein MTR67_020194 [Solanum verrucosum]